MKAKELRALVLENAEEFVTLYFDYLHNRNNARRLLQGAEKEATEVFLRLMPQIAEADDPLTAKVTGATSSERVKSILEQVATGELTPSQGEQLMKLEQAGFDITELPALLEKLSDLEKK